MSPVVILGSPNRSASSLPCVPFPAPGAPRRRMNTLAAEANPRAAAPGPAAFHEAVVVPEQEMMLHLLHGIEGNAHHDQERRAAEPERHVEDVGDDDREHRHHGEEDGAWEG